jgi:hypothetical protein
MFLESFDIYFSRTAARYVVLWVSRLLPSQYLSPVSQPHSHHLTSCYSLDIKCPQRLMFWSLDSQLVVLLRCDWIMRDLIINRLIHWWIHNLMALLGFGGDFQRWDLFGGNWSLEACSWRIYFVAQYLPLFISLFPGHHEESSFKSHFPPWYSASP